MPVDTPAVVPHQRTARKIDRKKVEELANKGLSGSEIARYQGVAPSTVNRYLERYGIEKQALEEFKSNRADILASIQSHALEVQRKIIVSLNDDRVLGALQPGQKSGLLTALNIVQGTVYDKERLERGESTANVSVLSRMLDSRISDVHKRKPLESKETAPQPEEKT